VKLFRYGAPGQERPGLLGDDGVLRDLSGHIPDVAGAVLSPEGLDQIRRLDHGQLPQIEAIDRYGPCVGSVGKFICVGLNYADHAAETGADVPPEPVLFMKATSAITGPNDDIVRPRGSKKLDWEVELGVVIGSPAKYVEEQDAHRFIAGFCVINDVSERQYQLERGGTWDKGKGCDTFGPIGPWLVTPDEVQDVGDLGLWLEVNGRRFQDGSTSTMIFSPDHLVSYCSQFMSLQPGDIISTGTPPGVGLGQKPPLYLAPGDVIELGISGLGTQRQVVRSGD